MCTVTSKDGTRIAYEKQGDGPAVILVGGGFVDRSENGPLMPILATDFTVYNYDRRGRGESADTLPYTVEREIEDIAALVDEAGGSAHLFGVSSGGTLALEAALAGIAANKVAVYEVPYCVVADMPERALEYRRKLSAVLDSGNRGRAAELFLWLVKTPQDRIDSIKASPYWEGMQAIAHTLAYDAEVMGDYQVPTQRYAHITQPTLVATGTEGIPEMPPDFFTAAAAALVAALPNATQTTLQGSGHVADPQELSATLRAFFTSN